MTAQHGGYRAPPNPNQVSGPGKFAKRTDGGAAQVMSHAPDQPYGAVKQEIASQQAAPMAGTPPMAPSAQPGPSGPPGQSAGPAGPPQYQGGAFNAPSARPNEPVTHGVNAGPGAGSEVLNPAAQPAGVQGSGAMSSMLQRLALVDTTGVISKLLTSAQTNGV